MKCKKIGCIREARPEFEACSALHGADLKIYRSQIKEAIDSKGIALRSLYTVEEAITYA